MIISKRLALITLAVILPGQAGTAWAAGGSGQGQDQIKFTEPGRPADVKKTYEGRCGRRTYLISATWSAYRPNGTIVAVVAGGVKVSKISIDRLSRNFLIEKAITEVEIGECRGDDAIVRISTVDAKSPSKYPNFVKFRINGRREIVDPRIS